MNAEMLEVLRKTWTHLCTKTLVGLEPWEAVAILKTPAVAEVEASVNRLALTGDVLAVQVACQQWANAAKHARQTTTIVQDVS
jgi:hypothetical protein